MHIVVTGGSGFIGSALVAALLRRGDRVSVLSRRPARARRHLPEAVRVVGSLAELGTGGVDAIVNLAGESLTSGRWTELRKQAFRSSRIDGTRALRAWCAAMDEKPAVLVSGSAVGWYGMPGEQLLSETSGPGDDFAAQLCQDWEAEAMAFTELGLRVCCARIGVVLGHGGALARMLPAFRLGLGGPMGDGEQWMSWIALTDLVALLIWLIDDSERDGSYNAVAPNPVRNAEFSRQLGAVLRRPAWLSTPAGRLRLLFGDMSSLLLGSQRVVPQRTLGEGFTFCYPELRAALDAVLVPDSDPRA